MLGKYLPVLMYTSLANAVFYVMFEYTFLFLIGWTYFLTFSETQEHIFGLYIALCLDWLKFNKQINVNISWGILTTDLEMAWRLESWWTFSRCGLCELFWHRNPPCCSGSYGTWDILHAQTWNGSHSCRLYWPLLHSGVSQ